MIDRAPVGVGPRAAAFLIDWLLFAFMIAVVWIASGGVNSSAENSILKDPNTELSLVITAAALVYFGGLESAWGATVGKRIVGLRVAMVGGGPVTGRAVVLRTLGRIIDCFLLIPDHRRDLRLDVAPQPAAGRPLGRHDHRPQPAPGRLTTPKRSRVWASHHRPPPVHRATMWGMPVEGR